MQMATKSNKRLALLSVICVAIFSIGMVVAHQCYSMSSNQIAVQHHSSDADSVSSVATKPLNVAANTGRLIDSGCAALFIVVLLFGRKPLYLRAPRAGLNSFVIKGTDLLSLYRPQVFQIALSRPQLGVIRI